MDPAGVETVFGRVEQAIADLLNTVKAIEWRDRLKAEAAAAVLDRHDIRAAAARAVAEVEAVDRQAGVLPGLRPVRFRVTSLCRPRRFAEMQIPLMMATLLHEADLQLAPPTYELRTVEVPFLSPDKRLKFKVTGRRHASTA